MFAPAVVPLDLDANGAGMRQHRLAGGGQENSPRGTTHELHADGFFEIGNGAADGDLGDAISARGGGEPVELDHSCENRELGGRP
jgi:hypothetical protein